MIPPKDDLEKSAFIRSRVVDRSADKQVVQMRFGNKVTPEIKVLHALLMREDVPWTKRADEGRELQCKRVNLKAIDMDAETFRSTWDALVKRIRIESDSGIEQIDDATVEVRLPHAGRMMLEVRGKNILLPIGERKGR